MLMASMIDSPVEALINSSTHKDTCAIYKDIISSNLQYLLKESNPHKKEKMGQIIVALLGKTHVMRSDFLYKIYNFQLFVVFHQLYCMVVV